MYRLYAVVVHIRSIVRPSPSFLPFLGAKVYYTLEAITLRTLRSLLDHPERIHKDGQSLLLWRTVRLRNRHKASRATNGKGSGY